VKFSFFHLMPYPHLPADFDEKYATPSLTFPNKYFDPKLGHQLYQRYLDELEYADQLGFDGIAVNEHHQTAYGLMPSPNIMAAKPPTGSIAPHDRRYLLLGYGEITKRYRDGELAGPGSLTRRPRWSRSRKS